MRSLRALNYFCRATSKKSQITDVSTKTVGNNSGPKIEPSGTQYIPKKKQGNHSSLPVHLSVRRLGVPPKFYSPRSNIPGCDFVFLGCLDPYRNHLTRNVQWKTFLPQVLPGQTTKKADPHQKKTPPAYLVEIYLKEISR